jgi:hypothetical protein
MQKIMTENHAKQLQNLFKLQEIIQDIHPFLDKLFPIAIVDNNHFLIYDIVSNSQQYTFIKKTATPMPIPQGVRAAFEMESYDNRLACVVTPDVFDDPDGYVTIFHEFIHCQQGEGCEHKLKQKLKVAVEARKANDYMWEINHPFPYTNPDFIQLYQSFLSKHTYNEIESIRHRLKEILKPTDYEYMVWQEWKEGFARYIENKINLRLKLPENHDGKNPPFTRATFYEGGAHFIELLAMENADLLINIEQLFTYMF